MWRFKKGYENQYCDERLVDTYEKGLQNKIYYNQFDIRNSIVLLMNYLTIETREHIFVITWKYR